MSFRLVPKLVTLNDLERPTMAVAFYYFTEFGKRDDLWFVAEFYEKVYYILSCVYDVVVKKVHVRYLIS